MALKRVEREVHTLTRGLNQYVFSPVPDDPKLVEIEVVHPERPLCLVARVPVPEGRECYRFLVSRGYQPW